MISQQDPSFNRIIFKETSLYGYSLGFFKVLIVALPAIAVFCDLGQFNYQTASNCTSSNPSWGVPIELFLVPASAP